MLSHQPSHLQRTHCDHYSQAARQTYAGRHKLVLIRLFHGTPACRLSFHEMLFPIHVLVIRKDKLHMFLLHFQKSKNLIKSQCHSTA